MDQLGRRRSKRRATGTTTASTSTPTSYRHQGSGRRRSAERGRGRSTTPTGRTPAPPSAGAAPPPAAPPPNPPPPPSFPPLDPSTNFTYERGVLSALARMREPPPSGGPPGPIDQLRLQRWLALAPSYLMHDHATAPSPEEGVLAWAQGVHALVGVLQHLHARGELQWETMDCASRAFAESWSAARCWLGMERAREAILAAGERLRGLLDREDSTRYRGRKVYPGQD